MTSPIPLATVPEQRTIPYDHTFQVPLDGGTGSAVSSFMSVSVEGPFTAVSIGYGAIPEATRQVFGPVFSATPPTMNGINLGQLLDGAEQALSNTDVDAVTASFRINPAFVRLLDSATPIPTDAIPQLFEFTGRSAREVQFLYALHDQGTGRAFQNEPVLSTAGLGEPDGERPFRQFAMPIVFEPRTTIRLEITPINDFKGVLHVSLHGYKTLGQPGTPTGSVRLRRQRRSR
jgi:hypothetical protein